MAERVGQQGSEALGTGSRHSIHLILFNIKSRFRILRKIFSTLVKTITICRFLVRAL